MAAVARKRRILVVEPDHEFLSILMDFLAAQKFDVDAAMRGDQVKGKIESFQPDVILLSRELPMEDGVYGPDGLRVLKTIKSDKKLNKVPVILASSEVGEKDFDRYRKLKFTADDYIVKPFEDTELLRRVENLAGFDLSDDMDDIKGNIDDAMGDSFHTMFDVEPDELGVSHSAATRREVSQLLEQVGMELDRQDNGFNGEAEYEEEEEPETQEDLDEEEAEGTGTAREKKLASELTGLNRQLDKVQKQLVSERKRSRDIKKEWKKRLLKIEKRLNETSEREQRMRDEFEAMRQRFADIELDHTMELERVHAEKRRLQEELMAARQDEEKEAAYPREKLADDLTKVAKAMNKIVEKLTKEEEEKK